MCVVLCVSGSVKPCNVESLYSAAGDDERVSACVETQGRIFLSAWRTTSSRVQKPTSLVFFRFEERVCPSVAILPSWA